MGRASLSHPRTPAPKTVASGTDCAVPRSRGQHDGCHLPVEAIHLADSSPQRTPMLHHAGSSSRGCQSAAFCVFDRRRFLPLPTQGTDPPPTQRRDELAPGTHHHREQRTMDGAASDWPDEFGRRTPSRGLGRLSAATLSPGRGGEQRPDQATHRPGRVGRCVVLLRRPAERKPGFALQCFRAAGHLPPVDYQTRYGKTALRGRRWHCRVRG